MLSVEGWIRVKGGGKAGGEDEGVGGQGEGVVGERVRWISVGRLRGRSRGPARAERSWEVMRGIAEIEVVRRDG